MDAARARTLWSMAMKRTAVIVFTTSVACKFCILLLELKEKRKLLSPSHDQLAPEETAGIINRSLFWWLNPLLLVGYRSILSLQDLWLVDDKLKFSPKEEELQYQWQFGMLHSFFVAHSI